MVKHNGCCPLKCQHSLTFYVEWRKITVTVTFLNTTCKAARQIFQDQTCPLWNIDIFHHLSISWDLMDGTIPASAAAQQQKPQHFPPFPSLAMADMDENLGDVVRWCRHIQLLEQMKHDFESLYFLDDIIYRMILRISNDGCPSNNCWVREISI